MTVHAGYYGPEILLDGAGRPLRRINVVVLAADGTTPATLYTDRTKAATTPTNAVATDSGGNLAFYADPGFYELQWVIAGLTQTLTVEVAPDFADQGGGGAVASVNGQTGAVVLTAPDVGAVATSDVGATVAQLVGGKVPSAQIPALQWVRAHPVADQVAMLALTGVVQGEDVAVRQDGAGTFLLTGTDPTQLASWTLLNAPADAVSSVNGHTGTVVLAAADVGADASGAAAAAQAAAQTYADTTKQPVDADLTTIAALDSAQSGVVASDGGGWLRKTYAQLKAALAISTGDVSGLGTAATHPATDFDAAGAAAAAQAASDPAGSATAVKGLPLAPAGATVATRYVGRWAATGPPASGTFAVGDFGFDGTNAVRICTVAGSPGTWVGSAASGAGQPVVRAFPFAFDTAGIETGAALYTPTVGDILLDAWIEVTAAWDGTTPLCDFGMFAEAGTFGWFAQTNGSPVDMTHPDDSSQLSDAGVVGQPWASGGHSSGFLQASMSTSTAFSVTNRICPLRFVTADPIKVVVTQTGQSDGASPASTVGNAVLYLVTVTPNG